MRKSAIVVVNTVSFTLSAAVFTLLLQQVIFLAFFISLGPRLLETPPVWLGRLGGGPVPLWWVVPVAVGAFVLVASLDPRRSDSWSFRTALAPIPIIGLIAVVAVAYRFIGLLLSVAVAGLYIGYARGRGRLAPLAYTAVALVLVSALPVDVTLQNVPGPPRLVPAVSGLPSRTMLDMVERGDAVMVGGCVTRYLEPSRMVVW